MPRTDVHLDGMLRHLGAAYYESLHGRATRADVARALDTVEEHLNEQRPARPAGDRHPAAEHQAAHDEAGQPHPRGWSRRVSDVMTTSVVTVDRITPYKEIARLLAEHRISGVPVLKMGREVAGVVTEADLLDAEDKVQRRLHAAASRTWWPRRQRHPALTAGELMTTPAITIGPHATIPAAARLMNTHHLRRLPVVDEKGKLAGIVSRRDLLSVFLRPDEDIATDVRRLLDEVLLAEPGEADVTVREGVVTLTGTLDPNAGPHGDLIPVTIKLMWDVDGVVDVIDRLGAEHPADTAAQAARLVPEQRGEPQDGTRVPLFTVSRKDANVSNQDLQAESALVGVARDCAPYRPACAPLQASFQLHGGSRRPLRRRDRERPDEGLRGGTRGTPPVHAVRRAAQVRGAANVPQGGRGAAVPLRHQRDGLAHPPGGIA